MGKEVSGYLAADGAFFERESNCRRYEFERELEGLCDSHGINFDNFMACVNAWHTQIEGYIDADQNCIDCKTGKGLKLDDAGPNGVSDDDAIPAFLRTKEDRANPPIGDKDAPGFLEQQIGAHFRVPDVGSGSHAETVSTARKGHGT